MAHINNELSLLGKEEIKNEVVDTLVLARDKYPGSAVNLDALCKRYRVDNSRRVNHTALIDCQLLSKVYINLIDQREPKLNFQNNVRANALEESNALAYFKGIVKPNPTEIENHKNYLKNFLKKNFF